MSLSNVFTIAGSSLTAQSQRLNLVASNISNAESATSSTGEPYRARHVVFSATPVSASQPQVAGVRVTQIVEDTSPFRLKYDPSHPLADEKGYLKLPNVNPVEEMADMISASRSYQTSVEVMNTAKTLLQKTLQLGQ
ncbi:MULTISPECIES: flagellar basal body rod protein FlgC [Craterilacuibacter]|uniref:Flagellar basal-body rod protein FlgC n=1 Tax=Craterilacuibacter sinensis TaxID=2686017 RepID=A0A845BJA1_9NEIS|nr:MULTISPECIES: flagellar basal body rod protein FlgC [Craterilacuibacter]MCP9760460.1 flagellar basal body rod protein FlgC [Aquitalea sp. S1-19]RQW29211.1 flagellar basal body rod protein FlgC [Rhodobacteraceae bacterium CH30]MCL6262593.1 flagellar basal body rod protein FlgC [Craterilacuibacter sp. RT1T]MCP9760909.1 flagellar basal body rod protein FlgC [Aquitalea sp. S1-19]MXR36817.1 flagellar basal body rod protein FlgC [Craterilacuibacter sinensis]